MKLTNVLKVFGTAALIAGLTPYRITDDEVTGGKKVRALFWEATRNPLADDGEKELSVRLGLFNPLEKDDEPNFFADELTVDYTAKEDAASEETAEETEEAVAEEVPADAEEAVEETAGETAEEIVEETTEEAVSEETETEAVEEAAEDTEAEN